MKTSSITFVSPAFNPVWGEDADTNPGVYGRALALWLAAEMDKRGFRTRMPIPEDFGWCIPVVAGPHQTYVACANSADTAKAWDVFVFSEGGLMARLLGHDERKKSNEQVLWAVSEILTSAE